ncbi:TPA: hypothetical protein N0F65_004375 [Lagenidium giganteum]|uniref:J domain-containing protein n=1 Tax=Lagenidium giganteum TaxID=4803 RepID=A0AAV2ZBE2_9STRA|nr:TPA: hypothetical protein N0F65_004375 [Lagenidium giganteum]
MAGPAIGLPAIATLAIVLALPAFFSIRNVGSLAALLFLFAMIPYVSICIWGAFVAEHWEQLVEFRHANVTVNGEWTTSDSHSPISIDWPVLVRSLLWNFSGFLDVSVFVTDVANPIVAYRRVMLICILLIPVMYMFPLGVGSAVNHPQWSTWEEGSLGDVARSFGGDAMSGWIRATGFLCAVGLFICTLLSSSFLASGMAESGLAPRSLARRSAAHNTPQSAVFCTLAVVLVIVCLEFEDMVVLCNALNAFTGIIVIMAAVRLRGTIRNIDRPTRLCRGMPSTFFVLALLIPLAIYVFVAIDAFRNAIGGTLSGVFILAGIIYGKQTDFNTTMSSASAVIRAAFGKKCNLYEVLGVTKKATVKEITSAYRKLALKYHPDKQRGDEASKAESTAKFQAISAIHSILSNTESRAYYDETGDIEPSEEEQSSSAQMWEAYFAKVFPKVTVEDINEFEKEYRLSEEERKDVVDAYVKFKGDMRSILDTIMLSTDDDEDRFAEMIQDAIKSKSVKEFPKWRDFVKAKKNAKPLSDKEKKKREAKRAKEAAEADDLINAIRNKNRGREDGSQSSALSIQREKNFGSLLASLESKYASKGSSKSKKSRKAAETFKEPSEEAFLATQRRLEAKRNKK